MKAEIISLREELNIVEGSGKTLEVIGNCKMFLETEVLGGRKKMEAAVIEGEGSKKKTLISLELFKKWDLIHSTFPHKKISDYIGKKLNKKYSASATLYNLQQVVYQ